MKPEPYWVSDDGTVTLYHGDCLAILQHLRGVDAVVTDPPYGVGLMGKRTKRAASLANTGYASIDDEPEIVDRVAVPAVKMCIERYGRVIVTPGIRNMYRYPQPADIGCVFNPAGAGLGPWGFTCYHPVLYYGKCPYLAMGMGHRPSGFRDIASGEVVDGHPCPKPVRWMKWLVEKASHSDQTIIDPFMGSGTTGVACVRTGRKFIGIEIEERYCAIAKRRIQEAFADQALFRQ